MTCRNAETIQDVLKRSGIFQKFQKKNKNKELVLVREGKAISNLCPCRVIKNERLTVKFIKALENYQKSGPPKRVTSSGEIVLFHIRVKGSKNIVKILKNPALKGAIDEITVFAYKGEKVKYALKRDDRLDNIIFQKTCVLTHKGTEETTEMSNLVDALDGKIYTITLISKDTPPDSQPGSLDDAYAVQNEAEIPDSNGDPSQVSPTNQPTDGNTPTEAPKRKVGMCEIQDSEKMRSHLSLKLSISLKELKKKKVSKVSYMQNLLHQEYGKKAETCREVKMMKQLMGFSDSVCQVRINKRPEGTGFLLFDSFVLTNCHVIQNALDRATGRLSQEVTVCFSYESIDVNAEAVKVLEVACSEYFKHDSGVVSDWALLSLDTCQNLPDGLLSRFGPLPPSGGICIIGHPSGDVKKIDPCLIVQAEYCKQVVDKHRQENPENIQVDPRHYGHEEPLQWVASKFFDHTEEEIGQKERELLYESCFYFSSSGSPVFDENCNVVAVHSGGYYYKNQKREENSVIEYGYCLSYIIERILMYVVNNRKDVLKTYICYARRSKMILCLNKMIGQENYAEFENAFQSSEVTDDQIVEMFLHLQSLIKMDTS